MSVAGMWPVAVVPVGRVACATTLWRTKGRLHVTVVVKARFAFNHNAVMTTVLPEPVTPQLGETTPYLTQADVVLSSAYAYPRSPTPAPALAVRLAVFREWAVIDKSLLVYPVTAEGGRAHAVQGRIAVVAPESREPLGILVNPSEASRPGSLGVLPPAAPERTALLAGQAVPATSAGVVEIPDMFPWSYFQLAPPDQRTSFLRGDEWVVLDGMDRELPRLQSRLPGATAQVYVYPPGLTGGTSFPVHMEADQLSIDVEARVCSILWRGSFPVSNEQSARSLILAAGVALPTEPVAWPNIPTLLANPILQAHGLVQPPASAPASAERRPLPTPRGVQEDADSMAETRNLNSSDAAALFAQLSGDEPVPASTSSDVAELEMSSDGVLSVHTLSESVILEVMQAVGEEAQAKPSPTESSPTEPSPAEPAPAAGRRRRSSALGLPVPDKARALRPLGVGPRAATEAAGKSPSMAPDLDQHSVDQLELTLSDALTAQGIATIDELAWRRPGGSGK